MGATDLLQSAALLLLVLILFLCCGRLFPLLEALNLAALASDFTPLGVNLLLLGVLSVLNAEKLVADKATCKCP